MPYVALHNHSCYSLLDSTMAVEEIVDGGGGVRHARRGAGGSRHAGRGGPVLQEGAGGGRPSGHRQRGDAGRAAGYAVVLLVENAEGYRNLCRLLTTRIEHPGRGDARRPAPVPRRPHLPVRDGEPRVSRDLRAELRSGDLAGRPARCAAPGRRLRIPLVATADAHYRAPEDRLLYDILASMRTLTMLNQAHPEKHGAGNYHLHSPDEMKRYFDFHAASD